MYVHVFVCLIHSDETFKPNIPMVPNLLNSNHENEMPEAESSHQISTTKEALYMTPDIGNKKPQQPLESAPQKVRYVHYSVRTYVCMYVCMYVCI